MEDHSQLEVLDLGELKDIARSIENNEMPNGLDSETLEKRLALTIRYHCSIDVEAVVSAHLLDDEGECSLETDAAELLSAFTSLITLQIRYIDKSQNRHLITEDIITVVFDTLIALFKLFDMEHMHSLLHSCEIRVSTGKKPKISDKGTSAKAVATFDETVSVLRVITEHYFSLTGTGRLQDKLASHFITVLFTILSCNTCPSQKTKAAKTTAHLVEVQLSAATSLKSVTQFIAPGLRGSILAGLYPLLSAGGGLIGAYSSTTCAAVCTQLSVEVERLLALNIYGHNAHHDHGSYTKFTAFAVSLLTCLWVLQASVYHVSSSALEEDEEVGELQVPGSMRSVRSFCLSFFSGLLQRCQYKDTSSSFRDALLYLGAVFSILMKQYYSLPVIPVCLSVLTSLLGRDMQESEPQYSIYCIDVYTIIVLNAAANIGGVSFTASESFKDKIAHFRAANIPMTTAATPKKSGKGTKRSKSKKGIVNDDTQKEASDKFGYDSALSLAVDAVTSYYCINETDRPISSNNSVNVKHNQTISPLDMASITLELVLQQCGATDLIEVFPLVEALDICYYITLERIAKVDDKIDAKLLLLATWSTSAVQRDRPDIYEYVRNLQAMPAMSTLPIPEEAVRMAYAYTCSGAVQGTPAIRCLSHPSPALRARAVRLLGSVPPTTSIKNAIYDHINDKAISVREETVKVIGKYVLSGDASGIDLLLVRLRDKGVSVRKATVNLLKEVLAQTDTSNQTRILTALLEVSSDESIQKGVTDILRKAWFTPQASGSASTPKQSRRLSVITDLPTIAEADEESSSTPMLSTKTGNIANESDVCPPVTPSALISGGMTDHFMTRTIDANGGSNGVHKERHTSTLSPVIRQLLTVVSTETKHSVQIGELLHQLISDNEQAAEIFKYLELLIDDLVELFTMGSEEFSMSTIFNVIYIILQHHPVYAAKHVEMLVPFLLQEEIDNSSICFVLDIISIALSLNGDKTTSNKSSNITKQLCRLALISPAVAVTSSSLRCLFLLISRITMDASPLVGLCATCLSAAVGGSSSSKQRSFIVLGELCDSMHLLPKKLLNATVTYQKNSSKASLDISLKDVPRTCFDISLQQLELPLSDTTKAIMPRAVAALCGSLMCIPSLAADALVILRKMLNGDVHVKIATLKGLKKVLIAEEERLTSSISFESTISGSKSVAVAGSYVSQLLPEIMLHVSHDEPLVGYHTLLLLQTLLTYGLLCPIEVVSALVCAAADENNSIATLALDILLTVDKQHSSMVDNRLLVGINMCADHSNGDGLPLQSLFHVLISPNAKRRDNIIVGMWRICSDLCSSIGQLRHNTDKVSATPYMNKVQYLLRHVAELTIAPELLVGVDVPAEMTCHEVEVWVSALSAVIEGADIVPANKGKGKKRKNAMGQSDCTSVPNGDAVSNLLIDAKCTIHDLYYKAAECRSWTSMLLLRQHVNTRTANSEGKYDGLPLLDDNDIWEKLFTDVTTLNNLVVKELWMQLNKYSTELHGLLHLGEGDIVIPTRKRKGGGRPRSNTKKPKASRRRITDNSDEDADAYDTDEEFDDL